MSYVPMQIGNFKFCLLEFEFEPVEKVYKFYGSFYRGMLGRNLKRRFCVLRNTECEVCPLKENCLYMLSFEKYRDVLFPPYIVNRDGRDYLRLSVVGSFCEFAEVYLQAYKSSLKIKKAGFFDPFDGELKKEKIVLNSRAFAEIEFSGDSISLSLRFVRLKRNSRMISCEDISYSDILKAIEKRVYLINKYYGNAVEPVFIDLDGVSGSIESCGYFDVKRYSFRKRQTMKIPSMNIILSLNGNLNKIYPFLVLSSFLNMGTNASMGFGQVKLNPQIG